jgi:hypothetical protein
MQTSVGPAKPLVLSLNLLMVKEESTYLMFRCLILLAGCLVMSGCAALAPAGAVISPLLSSPALPLVTEQTRVDLSQGNFVLVKTNVVGSSKGFSLLGLITMSPATTTKALNRWYAAAQMCPGKPQTLAHMTVERSSGYWILFAIPKVVVRADIVEFRPETRTIPRRNPRAKGGPSKASAASRNTR